MDSVYHSLGNKECCRPPIPANDPLETIEKLDSTIQAIEVRIKAIDYQRTQHLLKAKQFHANGDDIRCKAELRLRHEKEPTYRRYVNLQTNICRIRHSLDSTQTYGEIASHMGLANKVLEEALKEVNPERIDDLMDQLNDNAIYAGEVGDALARDETVFDEDAAMKELISEEPAEPVVEKELPAKKKENKRIAIKL